MDELKKMIADIELLVHKAAECHTPESAVMLAKAASHATHALYAVNSVKQSIGVIPNYNNPMSGSTSGPAYNPSVAEYDISEDAAPESDGSE